MISIPNGTQRRAGWIVDGVSAAVALTAAGLYLAGVDGGFDFTDEGVYYLSFAHPENVSDNQTSFHIFGGAIFRLLGGSIPAMRLVTFAALLGATLMLLKGWRQFVMAHDPGRQDGAVGFATAAAALTGATLGFSISPASLSYNFQNAICIMAATGLLLSACAQPAQKTQLGTAGLVSLLAFGLTVGFDFFVKFSSSVPLAITGGIFFIACSRLRLKSKALLVGAVLACAGLVGIIYFGFFQDLDRWWAGIRGTAQALLQGGYAFREINRYAQEITTLLGSAATILPPALVIAVPGIVATRLLRRWPSLQRTLAALVVFGSIAGLLWGAVRIGFVQPGRIEFHLSFLGLLGLFAITWRFMGSRAGPPAAPGRWRLAAGGTLLLSLPYIGAFGTTNNINQNTFYQLVPWFLVGGLLLSELDRTWSHRWFSRLGLLFLSGVSVGQLYTGYWLQPYRVAGTRAEQTLPTPIGPSGSQLRLNSATHAFVTNSRSILDENGFRQGDDILAMFNMPGFVFAMGGVSPGHPWYFSGDQRSLDLNLMRLRFIEPQRRARAFIVRNGDWDGLVALLRQAELRFPEEYELITPPMVSPFTREPFEIWSPKARAAR